jgi:hypothetical protein
MKTISKFPMRLQVRSLWVFFLVLQLLGFHLGASGAIALIGSTVHSHGTSPGDSFDGLIRIQNSDTNPATVRVYSSDYRTGTNGSSFFADPGVLPRSNGKWYALSAESIDIPAKSTREIAYRGVVPDDAQLKGSYWSLVFVEEQAPIPPINTNSSLKLPSASIRAVVRFATIILNEIGELEPPTLKVIERKVVQEAAQRFLSLLIENRGRSMTVPVPSLEVLDDQGSTVRKVDLNPSRIFPGSLVRLSFDLSEVTDGRYTGIVILDTGDPSQLLAVKCPIALGTKP